MYSKERSKKYYLKNKEKIDTYHKEYYQKNKQYFLEKGKLWALNNKDKVKKSRDKYYFEFRKTPQGIYKTLIDRSYVKKKKILINKNDFVNWYLNKEKVCYYCKIKEQDIKLLNKYFPILNKRNSKLEIERKDNKKWYSLKNIELACPYCNSIKSNIISEEDMFIIAKLIITPKWKE